MPKEVLDSFKHLDLADDFDNSFPVDLEIFVGLDFYWSFTSPQNS